MRKPLRHSNCSPAKTKQNKSHVLKEQSNVDRHNPEICYERLAALARNVSLVDHKAEPADRKQQQQLAGRSSTSELPPVADQSEPADRLVWAGERSRALALSATGPSNCANCYRNERARAQVRPLPVSDRSDDAIYATSDLSERVSQQTQWLQWQQQQQQRQALDRRRKRRRRETNGTRSSSLRQQIDGQRSRAQLSSAGNGQTSVLSEAQSATEQPSDCLDLRPKFVAQSSVCWFALGLGLSMYIIDLILRRSRRSRNPIELVDVRSDREGNLIELILSNNHKRFSHWLPGQFVYLNCPQISKFEWHPFTISSMDNTGKLNVFTLHIKTGGDWTCELRRRLESACNCNNAIDSGSCNIITTTTLNSKQQQQRKNDESDFKPFANGSEQSQGQNQRLDCDLSALYKNARATGETLRGNKTSNRSFCSFSCTQQRQQQKGKIYLISNQLQADGKMHCLSSAMNSQVSCEFTPENNPLASKINFYSHNQIEQQRNKNAHNLELFVDGPFHSPFERLLEQQVSVCISNGVGWTAFSSAFQCIIERIDFNLAALQAGNATGKSWWSKWRRFRGAKTNYENNCRAQSVAQIRSLSRTIVPTRVHLIIIVTTIEQLKPFYDITMRYFEQLERDYEIGVDDELNPVKEVSAYLTRSKYTVRSSLIDCLNLSQLTCVPLLAASTDNEAIREFIRCNELESSKNDYDFARVNQIFKVYFTKRPDLNDYLSSIGAQYSDR